MLEARGIGCLLWNGDNRMDVNKLRPLDDGDLALLRRLPPINEVNFLCDDRRLELCEAMWLFFDAPRTRINLSRVELSSDVVDALRAQGSAAEINSFSAWPRGDVRQLLALLRNISSLKRIELEFSSCQVVFRTPRRISGARRAQNRFRCDGQGT